METRRCPMCGQANPPHLEVCQYCQARLKPLWAEPSEESSSALEDKVTKDKASLEADEPLLPDWLLSSRSQMVEGESFEFEPSGEEASDFPKESSEEDLFGEIFSAETFAEEDVPDWLRSLRAGSTDEEGQTSSEQLGEEEPIPFWLDLDEGETKEVAPEAPSTPSEVPPFTEIPFEDVDFDQALLELQASAEQGSPSMEEFQSVPPFEGIEPFELEEPSALFAEDKLESIEAKEPKSEEGPIGGAPPEGDWMSEIPAWLETLPGQEWVEGEAAEPETPPEFLQGVVPPFVETDESLSEIEFPKWLDEVERTIEPELETILESLEPPPVELLEEQAEEGAPPPPELREEPPQAEIPVEVVGPLHGLRGVLPAEPLVAEQKKPARALSELLVTDKQRAQAELFLKLIEEEGKTKPPPPPKRAKPHTLWKILIFLVLFAAALVGLILRPFTSAPQELSVGVLDAMQAVNQLPAQATILLIVDMEGGDFAEMQATTQAMLDQMMLRGAFFVLVSANEGGALQADRLLRQVSQSSGHTYQAGSGWVNLGYLPGGVSGMQAFAQSLTEVLPNTVDGEAAWGQERLQKIRSLADFDLVLVITEDATRARQWIEQLKGRVAETRLLFAVSAQVEPVLRPYYQADPRQVQSVLSGIRDGAIYETQSARPGWAMQLWDAYTLVVLTGIVLSGSGALVYLLIGLWMRQKTKAEGRSV